MVSALARALKPEPPSFLSGIILSCTAPKGACGTSENGRGRWPHQAMSCVAGLEARS